MAISKKILLSFGCVLLAAAFTRHCLYRATALWLGIPTPLKKTTTEAEQGGTSNVG
jgi:hypothetical protein